MQRVPASRDVAAVHDVCKGGVALSMVLRAAGLNPGFKLLYLPKMLLHVEVLDKKENTAVLQKHLQHPCLVTVLLNKKILAVIKDGDGEKHNLFFFFLFQLKFQRWEEELYNVEQETCSLSLKCYLHSRKPIGMKSPNKRKLRVFLSTEGCFHSE